ncbi:serine protease [Halodesulfovibrio sp.]|jgi:serine protease Do|uniref:S1 family peptidase n=1 Tax=Halodesulfovibrio sp. TaxID=1912772 RepID=UPI0025DB8E48|nr:serine protease [Halodesulfovibrio sp.]MCT4534124.1 serine protease [Halodesulfovibrio sp.]
MYTTSAEKFTGGCMMLMRQSESGAAFLGSCFLVHEDGYMLTTSHLFGENHEDLCVVPYAPEATDFQTISREHVRSIPVEVISVDKDRDIALLALDVDADIVMPDFLLGNTEALRLGAPLVSLGYPFGFQNMHHLTVVSSVVSSKLISPLGNNHILFDTRVHAGDVGGPLVSVNEDRIVGIVCGRYCPMADGSSISSYSREQALDTDLSYAIAIEHGIKLMLEEDLEII